VLFWGLMPLAMAALYGPMARARWPALGQVALLGLNVVGGFLVGAQFPLANRIYLRGRTKGGTGVLYAADLAGAFLGALAVSVVLLPSLGVLQTCLLMLLLKLGSLGAVMALKADKAQG